MEQAVICDIDGVLVNSYDQIITMNRALARGVDKEFAWHLFYDNLDLCKKNKWCYILLEGLITQGITILYITGRGEKARVQTEPFLKLSKPYKYELLMRPEGRLEEDSIIKKEILNTIKDKYNILFAIDDKLSNCQVYQQYNITPLHVMLGDALCYDHKY